MYIHFRFENGSNPFIAFRNSTLFGMITRYDVKQEFETGFIVTSWRGNYRRTYQNIRQIIQDFAIAWQMDFCKWHYTQKELIDWANFFETYGKKYGLLREFRENGII